ncbi:MAG TPA: acylphosphatase [Trichocoleus sp.]
MASLSSLCPFRTFKRNGSLMKSIRVIVHGTVQGVGFRYYTQQEALRLGVTGYVRNLPNNTVEIVAEGSESQVDALLAWPYQGPSAAHVTQVEVFEQTVTGNFSTFSVER